MNAFASLLALLLLPLGAIAQDTGRPEPTELEALPPPDIDDEGVQEAPLPPKARAPGRDDAPSVTIRQEDDKLIEEYTQAGRLVMVRITPKNGPAYYLLDTDGDGELDRREDDLGSVGPVYWKLKEW